MFVRLWIHKLWICRLELKDYLDYYIHRLCRLTVVDLSRQKRIRCWSKKKIDADSKTIQQKEFVRQF